MPQLKAHPSRKQLTAYNLGQLPLDKATIIESHISECEPCCDTIISLSSDDTFVGLLKEARELPTDRTADHAQANMSSSCQDIPEPLAKHARYAILGLIGKGGMGDVYKARHRKMERAVSLKVINRGLVQKPEAVERFHHEVKAAAQLSHPNIVTAHDADQAGDFHFMVMEYVDGVDLSQTVKKRGALPVAEACDYILQAAIGLQHAHQRGMVHRDIKPHNMMVTADGTLKILDFGLASLAPEAFVDAEAVGASDGLTAAGTIMGTPDFISPEQANDARKADIRSDIYSLGVTLYFLLAGRPPFAEGSVAQKLKRHAQAEPEPLKSLRDDIPPELVAIVTKMTAKDPEVRYQTPVEVAEALKSYSRSVEPWKDVKPQTQAKPRSWKPTVLLLTAIAALFVTALFAGLVYYVQTDHGVVRVEVTDPSFEVSIKDQTITMKDGDGETLTIRPGEQSLIVRKDDAAFEFETDSFQIRRGDTIAFKVEYVKGEVVVRKDGKRFHSKALPDDAKVEQILDRMANAYAQCESYRDSGVIKTVIVENADSDQVTFEHSLTTVFERPDRFRFEIKDEDDDKLLISVNGQNVQTWWDVEPGIQEPESLELAMALAVGVSGGNVGRIPAMLMPRELDGWVDLDLIDPRKIEDGKLQNVACFRLEYNFRDGQIILWIDKQSYLVRRIDERIESDGIRICERTTTYAPIIDAEVTEKMFEFDPRTADVSASMLPEVELSHVFQGHHDEGGVNFLAMSLDGELLASASQMKVFVRKSSNGEIVTAIDRAKGGVAFDPEGKVLAAVNLAGVSLWDVATGKKLRTFEAEIEPYKPCYGLAISPDGRRLALGGLRGLKVWDMETGRQLLSINAHFYDGSILDVAFSPDGTRIASANPGGPVSSNGKTVETPKEVKVWDVNTGERLATLPGGGYGVAFSPDGKRIASGNYFDGTATVWEIATEKELHRLRGHEHGVADVAFSPDGQWLATAGRDKVVKVWDSRTGREVANLPGHDRVVWSVIFSSDGKQLYSAGEDKTIRVWKFLIDEKPDSGDRVDDPKTQSNSAGDRKAALPKI